MTITEHFSQIKLKAKPETNWIMQLRQEVIETFNLMLLTLENLSHIMLNESHLMAWVADSSDFFNFPPSLSVREKIISILTQYEYLPTQAPREIIVCPGFVGASEHTLEIITQLNHQKDAFKQAVLALKKVKANLLDEELFRAFDYFQSHKRHNSTAAHLRTMDLARLHLKQCYRKIPILKAAPLKISWTWANTRSIKKITVEEAQKLLRKKNLSDEGILLQLEKLARLSVNEPLAIVQNLAPHLRANLVMEPNHPKERIMVKGPIPIFFPTNVNQPWPEFKPPKIKTPKDKTRHVRNDVKLDPLPFLPAIRAHRYLII